MTYAELAAARGISKSSAIKLVQQHGWRRQRDAQGQVRAFIPLPWAQPQATGQFVDSARSHGRIRADLREIGSPLRALIKPTG
jgi:hypothetical protein